MSRAGAGQEQGRRRARKGQGKTTAWQEQAGTRQGRAEQYRACQVQDKDTAGQGRIGSGQEHGWCMAGTWKECGRDSANKGRLGPDTTGQGKADSAREGRVWHGR